MPLNDLAVFHAVIREGGFRAAAKRLGVAPSKVSTTITRIEAKLGVPLLVRSTRSVRVTDQGQALADRIAPLLAELNAACVETASVMEGVRGRLKLNVPGAVMPDVLPSLLAEYQRNFPAVEVEVVVENDLIDLVASGCDAGIRYDSALQQDMISIPMGPLVQKIALAASPHYLEQRGTPLTPDELLQHDAIRYRLKAGSLLPWILRNGETKLEVEPVTRLIVSVNALNTGLNFARHGMGVICAMQSWLEDDFGAGTLVPIMTDWWPDRTGPRLYYPNRFASAPLRAFIDLCRSKAAGL